MYQKYKNVERVKPSGLELVDRLVGVQRVTKVTKGGRAFGFSAIVVVGDENGVVGHGLGKSKEVATAMELIKKGFLINSLVLSNKLLLKKEDNGEREKSPLFDIILNFLFDTLSKKSLISFFIFSYQFFRLPDHQNHRIDLQVHYSIVI